MKQHEEFKEVVLGVLEAQAKFIIAHPYANSYAQRYKYKSQGKFNANGYKWVATHNYELDSGCYHIKLAKEIFDVTGDLGTLDDIVRKSMWELVKMWKVEQHHEEKSKYRYNELSRSGLGGPVGYTGMTWSGFRPSDDQQMYHYHIPDNIFTGAALGYVIEFAKRWNDKKLISFAKQLKHEIRSGIENYGIVNLPGSEKRIYAYEVDGLGSSNLMDDANIPSLLSIPLLDPSMEMYDKTIYEETKRFALSKQNQYYFTGKLASGIGSPHNAGNYWSFGGVKHEDERVWPLALIVEAYLMDYGSAEQKKKLRSIVDTTDDSLHESFAVDDYKKFTRKWFTWPDSLFAMGPWCEPYIDEMVNNESKITIKYQKDLTKL